MKNHKNPRKQTVPDKNKPSEKKEDQKTDPGYIIMDMPEVKDIPGQENIKVPRIREMEDTTISSADEEGAGIVDSLNRDDEEDEFTDNSSDVTEGERKDLRRSAAFTDNPERRDLENMALDSTDDDGERLNEKGQNSDRFGEDLDVPGSDIDDADEDRGEEDEENNLYSGRD
jgi:hypothetical protein